VSYKLIENCIPFHFSFSACFHRVGPILSACSPTGLRLFWRPI